MTRPKTVVEVAKLANVSAATVSRALNNPESVRGELRQRVLHAAQALGYTSNPAAAALRKRRSRVIAIVVPSLEDETFSRMVNGLQSVLVGQGYASFVQIAGFDNTQVFETVKGLFDRGAEALAIVGRIGDRRLIEHLRLRMIPTVAVYSRLDDGFIPSIGIDNKKATAKLLDLLLSRGHKNIAMIAGTTRGNDRQQARVKAFREIMSGVGDTEPIVHEIERHYGLDDGAAAFCATRREHPEVTAVMCTSHMIALGVLSKCREQGVRVPEDLSVTGFDDFSFSGLLKPSLTTLSVPTREIGRLAAEALIGKLDHERPIQSLELVPELMIRDSVSRAPSKR
jgi:LacI family transcriptional regulator